MSADDQVEIRLLGRRLTATLDSSDRTPSAMRERHILALLALHREVSVEHLISALWPDDPPPSARNGIQVGISRLRQLLGASAIWSHGGHFGLRQDVTVDVEQFHRLRGSDDPADWSALLQLVSRRVMDDLQHDLDVKSLTQIVTRQRLATCIRLAHWHLDHGDGAAALDLIDRDLLDDPHQPELASITAAASATKV